MRMWRGTGFVYPDPQCGGRHRWQLAWDTNRATFLLKNDYCYSSRRGAQCGMMAAARQNNVEIRRIYHKEPLYEIL